MTRADGDKASTDWSAAKLKTHRAVLDLGWKATYRPHIQNIEALHRSAITTQAL